MLKSVQDKPPFGERMFVIAHYSHDWRVMTIVFQPLSLKQYKVEQNHE